MTLIGANVLKDLSKKDLRILQGVEVGMRHAQYVEIELISKYAGVSVQESERLLKKCHKLDLVHRWSGHFIGYEFYKRYYIRKRGVSLVRTNIRN